MGGGGASLIKVIFNDILVSSPRRAWFLLLPSENVYWKGKCAAH